MESLPVYSSGTPSVKILRHERTESNLLRSNFWLKQERRSGEPARHLSPIGLPLTAGCPHLSPRDVGARGSPPASPPARGGAPPVPCRRCPRPAAPLPRPPAPGRASRVHQSGAQPCSTGARVPEAGDQRLPGHRRGPTRRWESHKILLLCLPPSSTSMSFGHKRALVAHSRVPTTSNRHNAAGAGSLCKVPTSTYYPIRVLEISP